MTARMWSCASQTRRGAIVVAGGGLCPSLSTAAYLLGGEPGLMGAISIENPRFADGRANQNQI